MFKRSFLRVPLSVVLAFLMLVDFTIFNPVPAKALDKKSVLIGAGVGVAAGAGIVLAAPAIAGAVGAAGGIAGIGTAIAGGLAAAGGALIGVVAAVGGAIAAGVGAVAGWLVGLVCSPFFIPALIIIAAVAIGYYLYKRHKNKQKNNEVISGSDEITVTPGDYDMNPLVPPQNSGTPVRITDADAISTSSGQPVTASTETPASVSIPAETGSDVSVTIQPPAIIPTTQALQAAQKRYQSAYEKYTNLVTQGGSGNAKAALDEYQAAKKEYDDLLKSSSQSK